MYVFELSIHFFSYTSKIASYRPHYKRRIHTYTHYRQTLVKDELFQRLKFCKLAEFFFLNIKNIIIYRRLGKRII